MTTRASERGSVLVAGLCMGVILVLCCMYVLDVAEAILVRAMGQNAADAVALEGAVWHAQGMNLLVLLNLIMAAIMSLLLAIRIAEIILIGAMAIVAIAAALLSFASFGTAAGGATEVLAWLGRALAQVQRFEDRVSEPIMRGLERTQKAERIVAAVVPYISLARPITRSADIPGLATSTSLFPAWFEQKFSTAPQKIPFTNGWKPSVGGFQVETAFPARLGTLPFGAAGKAVDQALAKKASALAQKIGKNGWAADAFDLANGAIGSLPAQEEDFYQLCERAGELVSANFLRVLAGPAGLGDAQIEKVSSFVGVVVGSLQTIACTPLKKIGDTVLAEIDKAVDKRCGERESEWQSNGNQGKHWDKKQKDACKKEERDKAGYKEPTDPESIKVARLWGIIASPKNSPFLHVWATIPLESRFGVDPANAMAEFRHVCDGGPDAAQRSCAENSMWRPGWFAKLVPVRDVTDEIAQKFGDALAGWFSRALGKSITALLNRFANKFVPKRSDKFDEVLNRHLGTAVTNKAANGWLNRRFLTGRLIGLTGVERISLLELDHYPNYLH